MTALDWGRLVVGLLATAIVLVFAARRVQFLTKLIRSGQPVGDEAGRKDDIPDRIKAQFTEVFGQKRLLKWSIPGIAHFFTMWGFFILATVYLEGLRRSVQPGVPHPDRRSMGRPGLPAGLLRCRRTARHHRVQHHPAALRAKEHGRSSRFYGSHTGGAWLILFMIFLVIATYAFFRGASVNALGDAFPYGRVPSSRTAWRPCWLPWAPPPTYGSRPSR